MLDFGEYPKRLTKGISKLTVVIHKDMHRYLRRTTAIHGDIQEYPRTSTITERATGKIEVKIKK